MKLEQGFVQIYTGNGKGKTTAAIGQAVRAVGRGLRVYFVQFMKNFPYGELSVLKKLAPALELHRYGTDDFVFKKEPPSAALLTEMKQGLEATEAAMLSNKYDLVILDEVLVSIYFKLFTEKQVLPLVQNRPEKVELILTGRYAPERLKKVADLISEINEVKHYYEKGVRARAGIES